MRKKFLAFLLVLVLFSCVITAFACQDDGQNNDLDQKYTITYLTDDGVKKIKVKNGDYIKLTKIPSKVGYTFEGLYDSEVGGTQFVNGKGISLAPFTDNTDMVLYARFSPKEYMLLFEAEGVDPIKNTYTYMYGERIIYLPVGPERTGYDFLGWYSEPNGQGTKIIANTTKISEEIFNVENNDITVYAYFEIKKFEVTLNIFNKGSYNNTIEKVTVEYGTPLASVSTNTLSDGRSVLGWSLFPSGAVVDISNIDGDMMLYSAVYGISVTFDSNGGTPVETLEAKTNESIVLPVPTRSGYSFAGWFNERNEKSGDESKFSDNIKLTAEWEIIRYSITYVIQDGWGNENPDSYTVEDEIVLKAPIAPSGEYNTFKSWDVLFPVIPKGSTGDRTFTAVYGVYRYIYTPEDLRGIESDYTAEYVLMNDLDLSSYDWRPIGYNGTSVKSFKGTFDGNYHTIKNFNSKYKLTIINGYAYSGLFALLDGATVRNLRLQDVNILFDSGDQFSGTNGETHANIGAIAGRAGGGTKIVNCSVSGSIYLQNYSASGVIDMGGLIGFATGRVEISRCSNSASLHSDFKGNLVGGLVGAVWYDANLTMSDSINYGSVYARECDFWIVGWCFAGGIVGSLDKKSTIRLARCINVGNVRNDGYVTWDGNMSPMLGEVDNGSQAFADDNLNTCPNLGKASQTDSYFCANVDRSYLSEPVNFGVEWQENWVIEKGKEIYLKQNFEEEEKSE